MVNLGTAILIILVILFLTAACIYKGMMYPRIMKLGEGPVRVSCIGDSITFGEGVFGHRRQWSYPAVLLRLLGNEYTFINYGLTNRNLMPVGVSYFRERTGKIAWNTEADILIMMLGTNDSKSSLWDMELFERTYVETIAHFQQMGCFKQILIMLPPMVFKEHPGKNDCNEPIIESGVIPAVKRAAEQCGVTLVDLWTLTSNHKEWFADGLHPNREGNQAIAEEIARHIQYPPHTSNG